MSATLSSAGSHLMTRDQLMLLSDPVAMGPRHRPIRHDDFVGTLTAELVRKGLHVRSEQFAVYGDSHERLFGVMELTSDCRALDGLNLSGEVLAIGLRGSNDQTFSNQVVGGRSAFVCDNLIISGDFIALKKKSTSGLNLQEAIREGVERFIGQAVQLDDQLRRASEWELSDGQAKALIYDMFADGVLPGARFQAVHNGFFSPSPEMTDCIGRTLRSLHGAFTRECRSLKPARKFKATSRLASLLSIADGV